MANIPGFPFPYFEVQFDQEGDVVDRSEVDKVLDFVSQQTISDLFIISHGWNNDMNEARGLYKSFFDRVNYIASSGKVPGIESRKFAVLGIMWPSKKFADEELIASGAAGISSAVTVDFLQKQLDNLKGVFDKPGADDDIEKAKQLVPRLEDSPKAQHDFADLIRQLPKRRDTNPEDASDRFFTLDGNELMKRLSKPAFAPPAHSGTAGGTTAIRSLGGPSGGAAGIGSLFSGIKSAARNLLNFTTYYQMKERAGVVGRSGVNQLIREIQARAPKIKTHLIGHSFGGRLVTAAAFGPDDNQPPIKVKTMTLLQAAFSHNGFAKHFDGSNDGFFRRVVTEGRISGPILITCSKNDKAVGIAYPLASLLAGQNATGVGDKNDPFGGIGRNGAQRTPEASDVALNPVGGAYQFQSGKLYNLNGDTLIMGHSDISKDEIAYALLATIPP
ncbi:MAG TPA: hypothetical protein VNI02_01170 [Blastocatellia bacterium]|jgi:hypothetical protein|nr:hypothetical protein [Blastocatellia bacterium]